MPNKHDQIDDLKQLSPKTYIPAINQRLSDYLESLETSTNQSNTNYAPQYKDYLKATIVTKQEKATTPVKSSLFHQIVLANPHTTKIAGSLVAGTGAVACGSIVAGAAAYTAGTAISSLIQSAIQHAFSGITSSSGLVGAIASPVVNTISSGLGAVAEIAAQVSLPLVLLYILVPSFYKLFSSVITKLTGTSNKPATNKYQAFDTLPADTDPLLELMCLLSTLALIEKFTQKLKLTGIDRVHFNLSKVMNKLKNPLSKEKLNEADKILLYMAEENSKRLGKIAKKAQHPTKLAIYENSETAKVLIKALQPFFTPSDPSSTSINIKKNTEIMNCIAITAALIEKENAQVQMTFRNTLAKVLNLKTNLPQLTDETSSTHHSQHTSHSQQNPKYRAKQQALSYQSAHSTSTRCSVNRNQSSGKDFKIGGTSNYHRGLTIQLFFSSPTTNSPSSAASTSAADKKYAYTHR